MNFDGKRLGEQFTDIVKGYVGPFAAQVTTLKQENNLLHDQLAAMLERMAVQDERSAKMTAMQDENDQLRHQIAGMSERLAVLDERVKHIPAVPPGPPGPAKDGAPGRDADMVAITEMVRHAVAEEVARIPRSADGAPGAPGAPGEPGAPGQPGKDAVVDYAALEAKIETKVVAAVAALPPPKDGAPGLNADMDIVADMVRQTVANEVAKIPRPADGVPGKDGKSVSLADLSGEIIKAAAAAVAALPQPEKGDPGRDVDMDAVTKAVEALVSEKVDDVAEHLNALHECAMDELQQQKAATAESLALTVSAEVAKAIAAQPVPTIDLADIEAAAQRAVAAVPMPRDGAPGKDGTSVTLEDIEPMLEAAQAKWALDMERRAADMIRQTVAEIPRPKDGAPGKDGRDAFTLEDVRANYDHERDLLVLSFKAGDAEIVREMPLGVPVYRGIYRTGQPYRRGTFLTYGGGVWNATKDIASDAGTPGTEDGKAAGWMLAVKSGQKG